MVLKWPAPALFFFIITVATAAPASRPAQANRALEIIKQHVGYAKGRFVWVLGRVISACHFQKLHNAKSLCQVDCGPIKTATKAPQELRDIALVLLRKMGVKDTSNYKIYLHDNAMISPAFCCGKAVYLRQGIGEILMNRFTGTLPGEDGSAKQREQLAQAKQLFMQKAVQVAQFVLAHELAHAVNDHNQPTDCDSATKRLREKRADLLAVKALGTAVGGIIFFEDFIPFVGGDNPHDTDHPRAAERAAYLRQWERKHNPVCTTYRKINRR